MAKKTDSRAVLPVEVVETRIFVLRGHRVILDRDLAELYGVETRAVNQGRQTQCRPPSGGLHVPAYGRRISSGASFKITICDLEEGAEYLQPPPEPSEPRRQIGFVPDGDWS